MSILQMSIAAGIVIVGIWLVRGLLSGKLPRRAFVAMWCVVLVRLIVPFGAPVAVVTVQLPDVIPVPNIAPVAFVSGHYETVTYAYTEYISESAVSPFVIIWIIGMIATAAVMVGLHFRARREYAAALPVESDIANQLIAGHGLKRTVRLRQSDRVSSPLTYGIIRPIILLPKSTDYSDHTALAHIIAHEMEHIRRFDVVLKWLLAAALCVHWFNPLVWLMYVLAGRDIELACDDAVVRRFGSSKKGEYAATLLNLASKVSISSPIYSSFAKKPLEKRVVAVMKFRRVTVAGAVAAVMLFSGIATLAAGVAFSDGIGIASADDCEYNATYCEYEELECEAVCYCEPYCGCCECCPGHREDVPDSERSLLCLQRNR